LIEELRVQSRHPDVLPLELFTKNAQSVVRAVRAHVRGPGEPAHRLVVVLGRQQVGALEALQLQAVLEQPQEFVGGGHVGRVVATDVGAGAQRSQGVNRGGHVQ